MGKHLLRRLELLQGFHSYQKTTYTNRMGDKWRGLPGVWFFEIRNRFAILSHAKIRTILIVLLKVKLTRSCRRYETVLPLYYEILEILYYKIQDMTKFSHIYANYLQKFH